MADGVELATGYVSLVISGEEVAPGVKKALGAAEPEADKAGARAGKRFSGGFSKSLKAGAGLLAGAVIGAKTVDLLKGSIDKASDLNETVSKSRVIFGKNATAMESWAKGADTAAGLSQQAALATAASFGDMFSQIGFGAGQAATMSKSVVQLAADLGSFNNLETADVTDRISAAFRGEYDSLQAVIPNISAARVEQEALAKTHKKTAKELTASEKAEAVLAIVRKDGARAVGDFAKTSGGLANQQKILKARTDDLQAAIGKGLLPVTTKIVSKASEFVEEMQDGTGAGGAFVDVLEDTRDIGQGVLAFFEAIPGPVKKYGAALAIAAIATSKFRTGISGFGLGLQAYSTSIRNAETRTAKLTTGLRGLGSGLTNVAGAGGMVLLADSTRRTSKELGFLEGAAGGALSGAALGAFGGPAGAGIGAGIGAIAGGVFALARGTKASGEAAADAQPPMQRYMSTLEGGAKAVRDYNVETARRNLTESGALDSARKLGIATATLVNATLGAPGAIAQVDAVLDKTAAGYTTTGATVDAFGNAVYGTIITNRDLAAAVGSVSSQLGINQDALKDNTVAANEALLSASKYAKVLPGLRKPVQTRIDQIGLKQAEANIVGLTRRYNLTPPQVETILKAAGEKPTAAKIQHIIDKSKELGRQRPTPTLDVNDKPAKDKINSLLGLLTGMSGPWPVNLDVNANTPGAPGRERGGPVTAGQPYWVGERRPEIFVPNQNGRIMARPQVSPAPASGPISLAGQRVTLSLFGRQIEGVFEEVADSRVDAARGDDGMVGRAF